MIYCWLKRIAFLKKKLNNFKIPKFTSTNQWIWSILQKPNNQSKLFFLPTTNNQLFQKKEREKTSAAWLLREAPFSINKEIIFKSPFSQALIKGVIPFFSQNFQINITTQHTTDDDGSNTKKKTKGERERLKNLVSWRLIDSHFLIQKELLNLFTIPSSHSQKQLAVW